MSRIRGTKAPSPFEEFSQFPPANDILNNVCFIHVFISRLHEFDEQVQWVREGMARVIPVPLLSLFTGSELDTMVRTTPFYSLPQLCEDKKGQTFYLKRDLLKFAPGGKCSCYFSPDMKKSWSLILAYGLGHQAQALVLSAAECGFNTRS